MAPGRSRLNVHPVTVLHACPSESDPPLSPAQRYSLHWRSIHQAEEYVFAAAYLNFLIYLIVIPSPCFPFFNGHDKAPTPSGGLPAPAARRRPQDPQPCKKLLPHLHAPRSRVPGPVPVHADLGFHSEAIGGRERKVCLLAHAFSSSHVIWLGASLREQCDDGVLEPQQHVLTGQ
jgi:hypothetical protein